MKTLFGTLLSRDRVLNLLFRVLTVIAKFALSLIVVKNLGVSELGVYGIFQTTVLLLIYVLGFDFYTYNAREITRIYSRPLIFYLSNQFTFHAIAYLIVLPLTLFLFMGNVVEKEYILLFYLVLVSEHISQELYRILVIIKKATLASLSLFVRSGLWVAVLFLVWSYGWSEKGLTLIFWLWFAGALISIVIALINLDFKGKFEVDWSWIKKGIRTSAPFFLATIFYKVIEFSGRYFLDFFWTKSEVGVFTFFSSVSNALFVLVHSTVIIVMSPYLLEAANLGKDDFRIVFAKFRKQLLASTAVGLVLAILFIYPLLGFMDSEPLSENLLAYFLLLLAVTFFCLSYLPHYHLYAFKEDKYLLKAAVIGASFNILVNSLLVPWIGITGAAASQLISMFLLFLAKGWYSRKLK